VSSYLTTSDADALAATLPGLAAFVAAADPVKAAALELATDRFDTARRYQGRKYDAAQALEFPRVAYESGASAFDRGVASAAAERSTGAQIWDWDDDANAAVVPDRVKRAVLYEANAIIDGSRDEILDAIANGLASQSAGGLSESYRNPADQGGAGGVPTLCRDAERISRSYQLRSGRVL
jgi:hypothetical protein